MKSWFKYTQSTLALIALGASVAHAEKEIAMAGPLTGQLAAFGEQLTRGANMAVKHVNESGGVLGENLSLYEGDDACDPKQAVSVANKIATRGIEFVAGHFCSGSSIPASAVYAENGVLMITPASTNPKLTDDAYDNGWDTILRVAGRDDKQGETAGAFIMKEFKNKNVAILHDKSAFGKGVADETRKYIRSKGKKETMYEAYTSGEKDFSALVSKMKQRKIGIIYLGGYHTEGGLLLRQARSQGLKAVLLGPDALNSSEFWSITGKSGEGALFTFAPDPRNNKEARKIVQEFQDSGYDPEGYTLYSYIAIRLWADAANRAGTTDAYELAEFLRSNSFKSVLGKVEFDKKGDMKNFPFVVYKWNNGKTELY